MAELTLPHLGENSQIEIRAARSPDRAERVQGMLLAKVRRELEKSSQ